MVHFWAKTDSGGHPGISVQDHMVNVGCVASAIAEGLSGLVRRFNLASSQLGVLAALHDLGKISPGFQRKCEAWLEENDLVKIARNGCWDTGMESDHGKVSHAAIMPFLIEAGISRKTAKFVSCLLGAHHGRLTAPNDKGYHPRGGISEAHSHIEWDAERMANARLVWDYFAPGDTPFELVEYSPALWWLAGLVSVSDWIGSDERFFSPEQTPSDIDPAAIARKALDEIGFLPPELNKDLSFESLFDFPPNNMQTKAIAAITGPGVYVIEAPMGMGKTEAALGAAYQLMTSGKATGIYFALPTQATSNRIHLRMNEFLRRIAPESPASRLIHGNSWLMDSNSGICPTATLKQGPPSEDARSGQNWFSSSKRSLIAPFGVGTVDQALLGVVAAKHFFVRHFALAGKVVILDEVHSYDLYTGTLIDNLITTLEGLGCTVIVLSATLTGKRRGQIVSSPEDGENEAALPYPLITGRKEENSILPVAAIPPEPRTVIVDFINKENACREAVALAQKGGAVLWICNTVDSAQKQYQILQEQVQEIFPIGLLHSRFPFWRRETLETEWMGRFGKSGNTRCGSILVSTQVVEQSVDLDADLLISELAPTDMLLQRIGRLWRHERGTRPADNAKICIIEEEKSLDEFRKMEPEEIKKALGSKAFVYAPYVLLRSLDVWQAHKSILIPEHIRILINETYQVPDNEPESWSNLSDDCLGQAMAHRQKALMSSNVWNIPLPDEEGVQTRLNEIPTIALVLCKEITKNRVVFIDGSIGQHSEERYRLAFAQAIHKNIVRVPSRYFDHVSPLPAFSDYLYGGQTAGTVSENGTGTVNVKGLKDGIRLIYSDELGLVTKKSS